MGDVGNKQERRKHRRLRVDISIEARIVDICESGILVETSLMLKKGTFITVTIDGLQFTAIVRHETGGSKGDFRGFGAEFQMLTAEHNDKIRKIMTRNPVGKGEGTTATKGPLSTIILVDDDPISRMMYRNRMEKGGFHVIAVSSFNNVEEMLLQGNVAAVVCDYASDTLKTIELLRKRHADLIICVLTLRGDVPLEQLQKLGVTYRSKALNSPEKFFNYLEQLLHK